MNKNEKKWKVNKFSENSEFYYTFIFQYARAECPIDSPEAFTERETADAHTH